VALAAERQQGVVGDRTGAHRRAVRVEGDHRAPDLPERLDPGDRQGEVQAGRATKACGVPRIDPADHQHPAGVRRGGDADRRAEIAGVTRSFEHHHPPGCVEHLGRVHARSCGQGHTRRRRRGAAGHGVPPHRVDLDGRRGQLDVRCQVREQRGERVPARGDHQRHVRTEAQRVLERVHPFEHGLVGSRRAARTRSTARSYPGPMVVLLVLAFVIVPIVEILVIIEVGTAIGPWWTVALLVADSLLGAWLLRREGGRAWSRFRDTLAAGRWPGDEVAQGAMVLVGGALLLTPGFVTDLFGLLLLVGPTRRAMLAVLRRILTGRLSPRPRRAGRMADCSTSRWSRSAAATPTVPTFPRPRSR
jgi:UPF0716 protein FxsA